LAVDTIADGELAFERVLGLVKELRDSNVVWAISAQSDWEEAVRSLGAIVGALVQVEQHARYMGKLAGRRLRQIAKEGPKAAKAEIGGISLADLLAEPDHRAIAVVAVRRR
jgi:hypothetical protein